MLQERLAPTDSSAAVLAGARTTHAKSRQKAKLRRDAMRADDLIGATAGDLGHAVELPGETAGAGLRRAQLHDQFAALRFPHHRADALPSGPAPAGIEPHPPSCP